MTHTSVRLVGKDSVFKEGLRSLLAKNGFLVAGDYTDHAGMQKDTSADYSPQLVITIAEETSTLLASISWIRSLYPQARIVIIAGSSANPLTAALFDAGADAFISKDVSCEGLVSSLKLAAAGEKVYPASLLTQASANANDTSAKETAQQYNLSRQELRIVHGLANGEPNKVIAHHLNISEATVKVHVRTVLRKLGARNRTKAAILAISQGIAPQGAAYQAMAV
jgi:two-component system nitrate/nitrite response regulator NarL